MTSDKKIERKPIQSLKDSPSYKAPKKKFLLSKEEKKQQKSSLPSLDHLSREKALLKKKKTTNDDPPITSAENPQNVSLKNNLEQTSPTTSTQKISATCSKDMNELIERLSIRLIKETDRGISKTTLSIDNPDSSFYGTKVEIKHYDTAPHSFHLSFEATDTINLEIENNLSNLQQRLCNVMPRHIFHIAPPRYKNITSSSKSQREFESRGEKNTSFVEKIME